MSLGDQQKRELRAQLQEAVVKCSERCQYQSAKWAAELLTSIAPTQDELGQEDSQMIEVSLEGVPPIVITGNEDPGEALLEANEVNKYLLAKSFFDCREFDRCAAVFLPDTLLSGITSSHPRNSTQTSSTGSKGKGKDNAKADVPSAVLDVQMPKLSQKSLFLALYAKLMSGEKKKDEDSEMIMGPHDSGKTVNKQLTTINRFLNNWFSAREDGDGYHIGSQGWLEFLYGVVLAKEKNEEEAMKWLLRSVKLYPMNWGCWLELTALIDRFETLHAIGPHLPASIIAFLFHVHTALELYQTSTELSTHIEQLLTIFPTSPFILTCRALLAYHLKEFLVAEHHFSQILAFHPHRLDSLDHYSNILFVMGLRPKLSFLAHLCSSVDRFRPETCVVIGNYYSLLSQHEKAVNYFRRALTLDRSCLSAWTLMGHEYVELKNTHAAIESYRRAVDINRRDYRAWYGLGQTYEMLEMSAYALWYFKRAAGLRPWDGKMWTAVGSCLQKMGRNAEGIKAMKRALFADSYYDAGISNPFGSGSRGTNKVMDPEILLQIANMYYVLGDKNETKNYMELCIAQEEGSSYDHTNTSDRRKTVHGDDDDREYGHGIGVTAATSKARMWLAKYARDNQDYETAMRLATELCQDGVDIEDAKAMIRELRARFEEDEPQERFTNKDIHGFTAVNDDAA